MEKAVNCLGGKNANGFNELNFLLSTQMIWSCCDFAVKYNMHVFIRFMNIRTLGRDRTFTVFERAVWLLSVCLKEDAHDFRYLTSKLNMMFIISSSRTLNMEDVSVKLRKAEWLYLKSVEIKRVVYANRASGGDYESDGFVCVSAISEVCQQDLYCVPEKHCGSYRPDIQEPFWQRVWTRAPLPRGIERGGESGVKQG